MRTYPAAERTETGGNGDVQDSGNCKSEQGSRDTGSLGEDYSVEKELIVPNRISKSRSMGRGHLINQDILIVMPSKEHPEELHALLNRHGISCASVQNVQAAFEMLKVNASAFLLLDFGLEGAIPFLKKVMSTFYDPPPYIIAVDAFSCSREQADILNLGADTCLEKPIDAEEALAVINAVLRRADRLAHPKPLRTSPPIEQETLRIDPLRRSVIIDGESVSLTVKEFDILHLLASYPGVIFSKRQIYERVWNDDYQYATTSVSDHISSMRKKLGLNPRDGRYIQTVHGAGYRFVEPK